MTETTPERRAELRKLLTGATPLPWRAEYSGPTGPVVMDDSSASAYDHVARCPHLWARDADLIADGINALPALLDALDAAEARAQDAEAGALRDAADFLDRMQEAGASAAYARFVRYALAELHRSLEAAEAKIAAVQTLVKQIPGDLAYWNDGAADWRYFRSDLLNMLDGEA